MLARRPTAYGRFARVYDELALAWSGGAIRRARRWTTADVPPGARVLVLGAGTGDAAVRAARVGAKVCAVDSAPAMLERVRRRAAAAGVQVDLRCVDLRAEWALEPGGWDVIAAPFVLSCIAADEVDVVVQRLGAGLAPDGQLRVADFTVAPQGGLTRLAYGLYYGGPSLLFGAFARNPIQSPHDLTASAAAAGLVVRHRSRFGVYGIGPGWYEGIAYGRVDR